MTRRASAPGAGKYAERTHRVGDPKSRLLASIVDSSDDAIISKTLDGVITTWNPAAEQIFGYEAGEVIGQPISMLIPADRADEMITILDRIRHGERVDHFETTRRKKDDATIAISLTVSPINDVAGHVVGASSIARDITERERIQDQARSASRDARSLVEASLDPLVTISPEGKITDVNEATTRVTGVERNQLVGTDFSDYFTEPDKAREGYQQVFAQGFVTDYPLTIRHTDGALTDVLYNASVYKDAGGSVLGVFAAARDVTQVRQAQQALRESEERLSAVFDHAPVGIDDISVDGDLVRVNPKMCEITGYTAGELQSMRIWDLIHPDDLEADTAGMQRLLAGKIGTYTTEKRYLRKGGEVVWAQVNRAAVRDPDGTPKLVVGVVRDITAQRKAEAEVHALNAELEARVAERTAELERANENLAAFTYSVSHDLRAPLRSLNGFSDALVEEYGSQLDDTARGYIGRIQAGSDRMATLIDDLLQLSRVSRAEMNLRTVDLSAESAAIVTELQSREPGRQVRFSIQHGIKATADRTLIRTVLQNLLENAWKFTARRDDATIEFGTAKAEGGGICCYVRDNGAGFNPAYAAKLFQPFQRLHAATDFPGTGIGLASVRRIVARHGGRVWADGAVGEGASFYFTLDAKTTAEPEAGKRFTRALTHSGDSLTGAGHGFPLAVTYRKR